METRTILLPLLVSIIVAISITYLVITYLPIIIAGVMLIIVAVIIFSAVLGATWFILRLLAFPYYALRQVKPDEEESKGGYRLEEVKQPESEAIQSEKSKLETHYCPQCSSRVQPDAIYCPDCGSKLH